MLVSVEKKLEYEPIIGAVLRLNDKRSNEKLKTNK